MAKVCTPLGGDGQRCIPGCSPAAQSCTSVDAAWQCSFPPSRLKDALVAQQRDHTARARNNEMVVDMRSVTRHLPYSVEAFFFVPSSGSEQQGVVRWARDRFLKDYHMTDATGPPLVMMDLEGGSTQPFTLA